MVDLLKMKISKSVGSDCVIMLAIFPLIILLFGCGEMRKNDTEIVLAQLKNGAIRGSNGNPSLYSNVELENIKMEGVVIENVIFDGLAAAEVDLKGATLINVVFNSCIMFRVYLEYSNLENVTFNKCRLQSYNPQSAKNTNVRYIDSSINSASFLRTEGDIHVSGSTMLDHGWKKSKATWNIENSTLEKIQAYEIQGRITLTNSTLKNANFEFGKMDSFESYDSTVDALGPGTIKEHLIVKGGQVEWVGVMNANSVHLDGVDIERFAMTDGVIDQVTIENCKNAGLIGFSQSTIKSLTIENCQMEQFRSFLTRADTVRFTNVSIAGLSMPGANFSQWHLDRVKLAGEIKVEGAAVEQPIFKGLTIADDANVLSSGANFSFSD